MDQFSFSNISKLLDLCNIRKFDILNYTASLCAHCFFHVPAVRIQLGGSIYLAKYCTTHGHSIHMIERNADFYHSLKCDKEALNYDKILLTEVTDRCNLMCPHCYHKPDNQIVDEPSNNIIQRVSSAPEYGINTIQLAGAEASLRPDFHSIVNNLTSNFKIVDTMTNGIRFGDVDFFKKCLDNGLSRINVGLNHPDYIGNSKIRSKQIAGIEFASKNSALGYVGYTMVSLQELHDILEEIVTVNWDVKTFRIRAGSEIGINATERRYYVSDIYKEILQWAQKYGHSVEDMPADDNIYHKMIRLNGKPIRIIQWCDITDIDLEELRSGPWNDFVPNDGITNFLHQIIRRDVWKNQGKVLPDIPPERYQVQYFKNFNELNLTDKKSLNR